MIYSKGDDFIDRLVDKNEDVVLRRAFILFVAFIMINTFVVSTTVILGDSMYPSLKDGETKLITKFNLSKNNLSYGDIVVFKSFSGEYFIKRIIGLPEDTIEIRDNHICVNNIIIEEDYIYEPTKLRDIETFRLRDDELFVLGDNRDNSMDSRHFGPIKINKLLGKIISN